MIYIGIDLAKDKHDCFIMDAEGAVRADVFTITKIVWMVSTLCSVGFVLALHPKTR